MIPPDTFDGTVSPIGTVGIPTDYSTFVEPERSTVRSINFTHNVALTRVTLPLFGRSGLPKYTDIIQGGFGSCWFLSSIASYLKPSGKNLMERTMDIKNLFREVSSSGTSRIFNVRIGKTWYRVDDAFPIIYPNEAQKVLWFSLLEKAMLSIQCGSYVFGIGSNVRVCSSIVHAKISSKMAILGLEAITGLKTTYRFLHSEDTSTFGTPKMTIEELYKVYKHGNHIVCNTDGTSYHVPKRDLRDFTVAPRHAYAILKVAKEPTGYHITLYNPWGRYGALKALFKEEPSGQTTIPWGAFLSLFACIHHTF